MSVTRDQIQAVMAGVLIIDPDLTMDERNELRRQAVIEFLADKPNPMGQHGSEHDMILSDLKSYLAWEKEDAAEATRPHEARSALQRPRRSGL